MKIKKKHVKVIIDALRAYVALRTEEYHKKPSLEKAKINDEINEALDFFTDRAKTRLKKIKKVKKKEHA
jgi:hypothetical protein